MKNEIAIIDYGMSNLLSITRAFEKIGARPILVNSGSDLQNFEKVVLPGVGAFPKGIAGLKERGFFDEIKKIKERNQFLLGVCLGMQMLLTEGEEIELTQGLDLIKGKVLKLPDNFGFKIPNVNWHKVSALPVKNTLLNTQLEEHMYFVHSYYVRPEEKQEVMSETDLGSFKFTSSVAKDRVYGVQFHPEKSGPNGLQILKKFSELK